jgi:hypothetical protein
MRSTAKLLALLSSALLLAGCTSTSIPEFETTQTARDIPTDPAAVDGVDPATTRFVGNVEESDLYLARGEEDPDSLCLIQVRDGKWEQTGCGGGSGLGSELRSGTLIEAGSYSFPSEQVGDGQRTELSPSVTVFTLP